MMAAIVLPRCIFIPYGNHDFVYKTSKIAVLVRELEYKFRAVIDSVLFWHKILGNKILTSAAFHPMTPIAVYPSTVTSIFLDALPDAGTVIL